MSCDDERSTLAATPLSEHAFAGLVESLCLPADSVRIAPDSPAGGSGNSPVESRATIDLALLLGCVAEIETVKDANTFLETLVDYPGLLSSREECMQVLDALSKSRAEVTKSEFWPAFLDVVLGHTTQGEAHGISSLILGLIALTRLEAPTRYLRSVELLLEPRLASLAPAEFTQLYSQLPKGSPFLVRVSRDCGHLIETLSAADLEICAGAKHSQLLPRLIAACLRLNTSPNSLASLLISASHSEFSANPDLHVLVDRLRANLDQLGPTQLAGSVYALGRLRVRAPGFFARLGEISIDFQAFRPQEVANFVYALGQLRQRDERLLQALADSVVPRASAFKPQELSITAYAFSQLVAPSSGLRTAPLLEAIAQEIAARIEASSAQAVSNSVYAMAKLGYRSEALLSAVVASVPGRLREFTPQHVSNIMFALGRLQFVDRPFLERVCAHVAERLAEFRPQNIANTVYACWKLSFRHEPLLQAVATHLPSRFPECVPQDVSNVIYAFAELQFAPPVFNAKALVWAQDALRGRIDPKDRSFLQSALKRAKLTP